MIKIEQYYGIDVPVVEDLIQQLNSSDPEQRILAAFELGKFRGENVIKNLFRATGDDVYAVVVAAKMSLKEAVDKSSVPFLVKKLRNNNLHAQCLSIECLVGLEAREACKSILRLIDDKFPGVLVTDALDAVRTLDYKEAIPVLKDFILKTGHVCDFILAVKTLGIIGSSVDIDFVRQAYHLVKRFKKGIYPSSGRDSARDAVWESLFLLGDPEVGKKVFRILENPTDSKNKELFDKYLRLAEKALNRKKCTEKAVLIQHLKKIRELEIPQKSRKEIDIILKAAFRKEKNKQGINNNKRLYKRLHEISHLSPLNVLLKGLFSRIPEVRDKSAIMLRWHKGAEVIRALFKTYSIEIDHSIVEETIDKIIDEDSFEVLKKALLRGNEEAGYQAMGYLGFLEMSDEQVGRKIIRLLKDDDLTIRLQAAESLGNMRYTHASEPIIKAIFKETNSMTYRYMAIAIGNIGDKSAIPILKNKLEIEPDMYYRVCLMGSLYLLGDESQLDKIIKALNHGKSRPYYLVREGAAEILYQIAIRSSEKIKAGIMKELNKAKKTENDLQTKSTIEFCLKKLKRKL